MLHKKIHELLEEIKGEYFKAIREPGEIVDNDRSEPMPKKN